MTTRFLASEHGARLDTDLRQGGGTDDTAALQALLDRARDDGGAHIVIDGPALVSGLEVYSDTTIEGTPGAGLRLADDSNRAILRNAHRTRETVVDENITVRGLTFWGNRDHQLEPWRGALIPGEAGIIRKEEGIVQMEQDRTWKSPVQFLGVRNLVVDDVEIWDGRAYALWLANVSHVTVTGLRIDVNTGPYPTGAPFEEQQAFIRAVPPNADGIHINGPADHVLIDGARIYVWDDAVSLCANDCWVADLTVDDLTGPYVGQGPITDVTVRNIHLDRPSQGVRILSADQRIDRVVVENVFGSVRMRSVVISHYAIPEKGTCGSILFRNIRLASEPSPTLREVYPAAFGPLGPPSYQEEADSAFFALNTEVEELRLEGVSLSATEDRPVLLIGPDARIGSLHASIEIEGSDSRTPRIEMYDGASVADLSLHIQSKGSRDADE
jgi:hypothetical protein